MAESTGKKKRKEKEINLNGDESTVPERLVAKLQVQRSQYSWDRMNCSHI